MTQSRLVFRVHAIKRMFERRISYDEIKAVIASGETIASYPNDTPFPSRLILGWSGRRPIHVVVAGNATDQETIVITVYEPESTQWEPGFKRRRRP